MDEKKRKGNSVTRQVSRTEDVTGEKGRPRMQRADVHWWVAGAIQEIERRRTLNWQSSLHAMQTRRFGSHEEI